MKRIYSILFSAVLLFTAVSCEDIVEGLNDNPNAATDAPNPLVLTAAQLAQAVVWEGHANRVVNMWSGYFNGADRQYADYALYNVNAGNFNTAWNNVYQGTMAQTRLIISRAGETGERTIAGIAKVVEVSSVATATQRWGEVPYSEAVDIEINSPAFDQQTGVLYPALLATLDEAIADLESGLGASPGSADIYFGGDRTSWIQVAHTLKARLYMDLKDYTNAYSEAQQGVADPSRDMITPHGTINDGNYNFVYDFLVVSRAGDMDAGVGEDEDGNQVYAADLLDPTQPEYRGNDKTDESARFNFAYLDAGANSFTGRLEPNYWGVSSGNDYNGLFAIDAGFRVVTYAENILTLAEAGFRTQGFNTGLTHLNEFRAYMDMGGYIDQTVLDQFTSNYDPYTADDFTAGGVANDRGTSADDALLYEILEERYLTFIGTSLGWSDLKRTQGDAVRIDWTLLLNRGSQLPQRLIYGQDELNSNENAPSPVPGVFDTAEIYQ